MKPGPFVIAPHDTQAAWLINRKRIVREEFARFVASVSVIIPTPEAGMGTTLSRLT